MKIKGCWRCACRVSCLVCLLPRDCSSSQPFLPLSCVLCIATAQAALAPKTVCSTPLDTQVRERSRQSVICTALSTNARTYASRRAVMVLMVENAGRSTYPPVVTRMPMHLRVRFVSACSPTVQHWANSRDNHTRMAPTHLCIPIESIDEPIHSCRRSLFSLIHHYLMARRSHHRDNKPTSPNCPVMRTVQ